MEIRIGTPSRCPKGFLITMELVTEVEMELVIGVAMELVTEVEMESHSTTKTVAMELVTEV